MTREELIDALLEAPASSKADLRTYHGEAGKAVANNPKAYKKYKKGYKKRRRLNAVVTGATTVGGAAAGTLVGQPLAGAAVGAGMGYTRRKRRNRAAVATAHSWLKSKNKKVHEAVNAKELKTRLKHPLKASRHGEVYDTFHGKTRVYGAPTPVGVVGSYTLRNWRGPGKKPGVRMVTKSGRKYEQRRKKYVTKAIKREVKKRQSGKKLSHDQKWSYHRDLDKGYQAPPGNG